MGCFSDLVWAMDAPADEPLSFLSCSALLCKYVVSLGSIYLLSGRIKLTDFSAFPRMMSLKKRSQYNALCSCVYIYIWQLSSFRAPTLWFIDLTVATCHNTLTGTLVYAKFFTRKRTKHANTRRPSFSYDAKMAADGYWARKALILREVL